jgi:SPP1 gp7 family putative phage head morphogenesis protein
LAVERVQEEIEEGVTIGETNDRIAERIGQIFNDPDRARRIAVTETARVMHAGQMAAAVESGVVSGMRWLASSDACERCANLDGVVVPLGKPFEISGVGPYSRILHPPLHPHCMCTITEEIG